MTLARSLSALAALVVLATALPALAGDPAAIRVMSYNIRVDVPTDNPTWTERRPHMARQIAFTDPDLLGVQEAHSAMVQYLADQLPGWDRYGVGRDDGGPVGETTTLFWRRDRFDHLRSETFWCSPTPEVPSKGWDAAYPRTVTRVVLRDRRDGRLLDVRNTHFDHVGVVAREQCAALVAAMPAVEIDGAPAQVILMGDFNTGQGTPPYQRILATGLRDARTVSPVVFGPDGTFNNFNLASDNGGVAIDHVFIGDGLAVERFGVLTDSFGGRVISDHFPLVVDIVPVRP
ncbi:endonuclease/exonuclease/phosphatase family protein [Brevundimonas lenta]|uniref:Endonuclease/exonuclease/phosphatase family metal-dependent hydrolase n=1 Tax=Brevundimonas lenta TaxID=424796 RepID=A0A7W6JAR8_9CAUL|nr:endonuclease/exonuclease/phosphatase family protein [Brevundimonas lenta]MBB4081637.1 endonuclease/exonuclease/phosphatase family metal-dependent hydrolase [Brevundimonas lenta]